MTALHRLSIVILLATATSFSWPQGARSPADAFDDSLAQILAKLGGAESAVQASSRGPAEKKRAQEKLQHCGAMLAGIRRQLAEYFEVERISAASSASSEQNALLLELLRRKRNVLAPVIAGAAHALVNAAFDGVDIEPRRHCKEAADAAILALLVVADLAPIPGAR